MSKDGSETEIANEIVYEYNLSGNYPNPFNPSTKIEYTLKEKGFVSIKVYDIIGREVVELVNESKQKGNHSISFNTTGKDLTSGIYFYTIIVNEYSETKKMILVK